MFKVFRRKKATSKLVTVPYGVRNNPHKAKIEQVIEKHVKDGYVLAQRQDVAGKKRGKTELTFVLREVAIEDESPTPVMVEVDEPKQKVKAKPEPVKLSGQQIVVFTFSIFMAGVLLVMMFSPSGSNESNNEVLLPTKVVVASDAPEVLDSEQTMIAIMSIEPSVTMTNTPLPSPTPTVTNTPMLSATPSLEDIAIEAVEDAMTAKRDDIEMLIVNDIVVTLRFPLNDVSAGFARREAELMFPQLVCNLRDGGLVNRDYQITGMIDVVDALGNSSTAKGVEMILPWSVTEQLNCENVFNINLAMVAERWSVSPLLQE